MSHEIPVTRPFLPPFEDYISIIKEIWDNHWLTNSGPIHEKFVSDLKKYLNVQNLSLFTNGHNALEAGIHSLCLPMGSDVITTPFTFASTIHAIVRNGLNPVFCDISYDDYNIDINRIEELISENTSAILPVHVYGTPCSVYKIEELARRYNIKVIYDAAHAFGVKINNCPLVSFGDLSMLSFHATKVFNSIEGGAIVSKSPLNIKIMDQYKNFGMVGTDDFIDVGTNAKMSEFHAAMGICNLKYVDECISRRCSISKLYDSILKDSTDIKILRPQTSVQSNYAYYPIVLEKGYGLSRDDLQIKLVKNGVHARKYFYPLVSEFSCYRNSYSSSFPIASKVSKNVLCLPLYDTMKVEDVEYICSLILGGI